MGLTRKQEGKWICMGWDCILRVIIVFNIITFIIMGTDKYKARKGQWRISEGTLFLLALSGGSLGILIGMYFFHHKTQHWQFIWGIPFIIVLQAVLLFRIWNALLPI